MGLYLIIVEGDVEPDIGGPYADEAARDKRARELREEHGDETGIYMLDIDEQGNPTSGAYSGGGLG